MDPSKLKTGDIAAAVGGVLLIVSLFLDWFGGSNAAAASALQGLPGLSPASLPKPPSLSGWDALAFIDYVLLLTGLVAIKQAGVRAAGLKPRIPVPIAAVTTGLGGVAFTLVLWRIFDPVADGSLKAGIFLALIATVVLAGGGYLAAREDGFDFYETD